MKGFPGKALLSIVIILGLIFSASLLYAGSTGKIKGVVIDKATKEPIPGASVSLVGTTQGAMTDPDGKFLIMLVPPGSYTLKISSVSYSTAEVDNLEVKVDYTTEQNISMEKSVTELDKVIKVVANKDILDIGTASSKVTMSKETIEAMPVQNVDQLLKQTAGVVTNTQGEILIRGGRAGEVSYIVDGVAIGDPLGGYGPNNLGLSLTSGSIQELSIIKDGFDPEYGNALSGVVRITTQTGSTEKTNLALQVVTDDLGDPSLNEYSSNYDYVSFTVGGPDPILSTRLLPALGLNFLEDKEVTYFFFGEVSKSGTSFSYDKYTNAITKIDYKNFNLLGLDIPERQSNTYNLTSNILLKPVPNMKLIFSLKAYRDNYLAFDWQYKYTPVTSSVVETKWNVYALEMTHQLSKNMHYYLKASYYERDFFVRPGDPDNPGRGLDPDEFLPWYKYESYDDLNGNGVYDAPEPVINLFPDSMNYGKDLPGPAYTTTDYIVINGIFYPAVLLVDGQNGGFYDSDFRFNSGYTYNFSEGEPYADLNGNGQWDRGDYLYDNNGNGQLDADWESVIDQHTSEPYEDGDINLGEPFIDINNDGVFTYGIDQFDISTQDLNSDSRYNFPYEQWEYGIPFIDRNGNGIYDAPNGLYDYGEEFTDVNGNGTYDAGGQNSFLDMGSYAETVWHHRNTKQYVMEGRIYRQLGNHELKAGLELKKEFLKMEDIRNLEQPYTGRPDGGVYPTIGSLRDFYDYEPLSGSVYFRDMLEYGSMIASLGFRYDYFIQTKGLEEVAKNDDLGKGIIYGDRNKFSPRIGFSYPISDKAKVHFNYGHFYQLPLYTYMYSRNTTAASANDIIGNYNLDYEKTIQYSFGVKYAMSADYSIDISGYYKDEFDKINSASVKLGEGYLRVNQYQNRDYGRSRGFELTIEKRGGHLINGEVNYTYAFSYGKQSQARDEYFEEFYLNQESLKEKPLDDDVRHQINCAVQLVMSENLKPRLFGIRIPNGWTLAVTGNFRTGKPYTPDENYPNLQFEQGVQQIDENSLRMPSVLNFDIRFEKYFKLVGFNWRFIMEVYNLLDNKNVAGVYSRTGRADTNNIPAGSDVVYGGREIDRDPGNWQYGRQIRAGFRVDL
ncbi:MAG: TonB-dependent receptor [Candidatus Zixiibacteriota bacterium]